MFAFSITSIFNKTTKNLECSKNVLTVVGRTIKVHEYYSQLGHHVSTNRNVFLVNRSVGRIRLWLVEDIRRVADISESVKLSDVLKVESTSENSYRRFRSPAEP